MRLIAKPAVRKLMVGLFLVILISNLTITFGSRAYASSQSKFELVIQRAKELDQIESLPWSPWLLGQDGADWSWKVQFCDGSQWLPWENERSGGAQNPDANRLNQAYSWVFDTPPNHIIRFRIELWDSDVWPSPPDLADLSSKPGEGVGDWNGAFVAGAVFEGVYNLETMNFTSDSDQVQLRYNPAMSLIMYVASGEYDGTYGSGGLDAEVWFEVKGEFHDEAVPSDIAIVNVTPLKTLVASPYPNYIKVDVRNNCSNIIRTYVNVYANNSVIGTQYVNLLAYEQQPLTFVWQTAGFEGTYIISAMATQLSDETDISNNLRTDGPVTVVSEKAYFIIVAGNRYDNELLDLINGGCNQVYNILRNVGFSSDEIYYLNQPECGYQDLDGDGKNDIDGWASNTNLRWAIETWATSRVSAAKPLYLYLFDHGGLDLFCINNAPEYLYSSELSSLLNALEVATDAKTHVVYAACESGSFINELSRTGRVIATSSRDYEPSSVGPDGTWEAFSIPFWNSIKSGHSMGSSFNTASAILLQQGAPQRPLLDDNGDLVGHTGQLPNSGDGLLADSVYIGACEWVYPWISHAMPKTTYTWPPLSDVKIWAQIENQTSLSYVKACMKPPDWVPPSPNDTLVVPDFEVFYMSDSDRDGNWTVDIPTVDFTDHTTEPAQFRFLITAREESGDIATPSIVTVEFTNGTSSADASAPYVFLERPLAEQVVYDETLINGTAVDDTCLSRIELWQEIDVLGTKSWNLTQAIIFPQESTSYFEFHLSTASFTNGPSRVYLRAYDSAGNYCDQNVTFLVNHYTHDIAATSIRIPDTIEHGQLILVNVTVANHGSYQESFDLDLYLNMTSAITERVNLAVGVSSTVILTLNTTGFGAGCYTVSSYASPVMNETNTDNNLYVTSLVNLTGSSAPARADLNVDCEVDILDAILLCRIFGESLGTPRYNENADFNVDGRIDIIDCILLADHFGEKTAA